MLLSQPLDDILSCGTKVAILRLLCLRGGSYTGREIARQTGLSASNTARALHELTAALMVEAQPIGRAIAYRLTDSEAPLVRRLRELFGEEQARRQQAAEAIARRVPGFVSLILFGSEARGAAKATSDTDLLVIVEGRTEELDAQVDGILLKESLEQLLQSSWLIADLQEVVRWEEERSEFWHNIVSEGVVLSGASLERLRRHGHMADALASGS
jgi:predicted nucleotidyltransferase